MMADPETLAGAQKDTVAAAEQLFRLYMNDEPAIITGALLIAEVVQTDGNKVLRYLALADCPSWKQLGMAKALFNCVSMQPII